MGIISYTQCDLLDEIGATLTLVNQKHWQGHGTPPASFRGNASFKHDADSTGSVGAVVYKLASQSILWTFAWSNLDGSKKVYTEFIDENNCNPVDWNSHFEFVKSKLQESKTSSSAEYPGFKSNVDISTDNNATPTMKAKLSKA